MTIQVLAPQVANQIAAGEVVERPSAVVKELIENSFDAGATSVLVDIVNAGAKRILIRDNGKGIPQKELGLALKRHATSKISSIDDLNFLISMGFRGEALASIAAVSRLTLTSKPQEQDLAYAVSVDGLGQEPQITPSSHPKGTTIEVCDLFFNTPARRRFLRSEKTEFMQIEEIFRRLALSRNDVAMNLKHNGKVIYDLKTALDEDAIRRRLAQIMGGKFAENAHKVDEQMNQVSLKGYIDLMQDNKPSQYFFVNHRIVKDKTIIHAVKEAFNQVLGKTAEVSYVFFLSIPPADVDINVHPQKYEVRFRESRFVHDFIQTVITNLLNREQQVLPETFKETVDSSIDHNYGSFEVIEPVNKSVESFINSLDAAKESLAKQNAMTNSSVSNKAEGTNRVNSTYQKMFGFSVNSKNSSKNYNDSNIRYSGQDLNFLQKEKNAINSFCESKAKEKELIPGGNIHSTLQPEATKNNAEFDCTTAIKITDQIVYPWLKETIAEESLFSVLVIEESFYALVFGVGQVRLVDLRKLALHMFKHDFEDGVEKYDFLQASKLIASLEITVSEINKGLITLLNQIGFEISIGKNSVIVEAVPRVVRSINIAKLIEKIIVNINENMGRRELIDALSSVIFIEKQPLYFSLEMAQRLVSRVHYVGYWQEIMPGDFHIVDVSKLVKEYLQK